MKKRNCCINCLTRSKNGGSKPPPYEKDTAALCSGVLFRSAVKKCHCEALCAVAISCSQDVLQLDIPDCTASIQEEIPTGLTALGMTVFCVIDTTPGWGRRPREVRLRDFPRIARWLRSMLLQKLPWFLPWRSYEGSCRYDD